MPKNRGAEPSLDGGLSEAKPYIAKVKGEGDISALRQAIRNAPLGQCPNQVRAREKAKRDPNEKPQFVYSPKAKKAYSVNCGRWTCDFCGWKKQKVATYLVFAGMQGARKEGRRLRFMTLTEDPKRPLDVAGLSKCWNKLRTELKQKGLLDEYAAAFEVTKKGRPHLHVLFSGEFINQRKLAIWAERVGFGRVTDIRAVGFDLAEDNEKSAAYISKEMAGYVSKSKGAEAGKLVAKRRRPLRTSQGWYPGGMKRAERELLEGKYEGQDEAPFWFVRGHHAETLTIRGTGADGKSWTLRDLPTTDQLEEERGKVEAERASAVATLRTEPTDDEELRRLSA
uniref:Replication-associated protein ORF2/G2P domain-containing protein n=1 Tax=uncultured prokaryote TaxID=198431 RepID=A0A0H5Q8B7_9ZZZZ|nr:hypothetical protein [uncultured prokaryote]